MVQHTLRKFLLYDPALCNAGYCWRGSFWMPVGRRSGIPRIRRHVLPAPRSHRRNRCPGDPPVSPLPSKPGGAAAKRPVNLERCLDSCVAGGHVLIQFCNDISDAEIRAVCFSKLNESEANCRNFCFNYF
ncbi:uncharacterized protein STAUR_3965 [Stigmatella aurantiaca DW4/3-1]|uniref:Uncharacterized protein n=1 Tax=Stigmatella aurantiaca (strain DW4/3-1) TaxID=378806 RepID=E3FL45_STIAD|nr:uncharacterized protein STAUR_3965 [Stigmatella aurantiaca DW4/3-1]